MTIIVIIKVIWSVVSTWLSSSPQQIHNKHYDDPIHIIECAASTRQMNGYHHHYLLLHSPVISLGFTIFGEIFAYVTLFFNPNTFRLHGWCMLGVFMLSAFTHLGPHFILSSERLFGRMESEPMLTPREKSPLPEKILPRGGSNP